MGGSGGAPRPPKDLPKRKCPEITLPAGTIVRRIHDADYGPVYYGRSGDYRFDVPKITGVCYAAEHPDGAFVETFGRGEPIDRAELEGRAISKLRLKSPAKLVKFFGDGLLPLGATAEVTATRDYDLSRAWSAALFAHPQKPDGIAYLVRHDNTQMGYAIFERSDLLEPADKPTVLIDYSDVWDLIDKYDLTYHG